MVKRFNIDAEEPVQQDDIQISPKDSARRYSILTK